MKVGVIGVGVVGLAVYQGFKDRGLETFGYDKFKPELQDLASVLKTEVIFICVPTPTIEDGNQDYTALEDVLSILAQNKYSGAICIKSTVIPGTCHRLASKHNLLNQITHNPEFLTAAKPYQDFMAQKSVLISGYKVAAELVAKVYHLAGFDGIKVYEDLQVTEAAKYVSNNFLAVKVSYFNEVLEWCQASNTDFHLVRDAALSVGLIGEQHSKVPGPDGSRGYGGMCFIKDSTASSRYIREDLGLKCDILDGAIAGNKRRRPHAYDGTENTGLILKKKP